VPYDTRKPFDPSGLRLGTAGITTRGLTEEHMPQVAAWFSDSVDALVKDDEAAQARIAGEIADLLAGFPMPGWSRV
jgi:glycine hydroxymethyltransferase